MDEQAFDFMKYYATETWEEMRHNEKLRLHITVIVVSVSGALASLAVNEDTAVKADLMAIVVVGLGLFGALMVRKLYQIHQLGQARLNRWHAFLAANAEGIRLVQEERDAADRENRDRFWLSSRISHNHLWVGLNLFVAACGVFILAR